MNELLFLFYAAWVGFLNLGAGRDFFGKVQSTALSRTIFAIGAACPLLLANSPLMTMLIAISLFLWRMPGWGDFFAAIHGRKTQWRTSGDAKWACWVSDKIWPIDPKEGMETKLKATLDMSIRMSLIIPAVLLSGNFITWIAFPLLGIAYFVSGLFGEQGAVAKAEFLSGIIIAFMLWGV